MTSTTRTRRRLAAFALPAALLFAACGGDDSSADDTDAIEEPDATDAPDATVAPDGTASDTTGAEVDDTSSSTEVVDGFEFAADDYTVVFPSEPETTEQMAPTADGTELPITIHLVEDDERGYTVAEFTIPEGEPYSLEGGRDGAIAAVSGELVSSEEIEYDGAEGVEFVAAVESNGVEGVYVSRILTADDRVYQVAVTGPEDFDASDPDVTAFFDSLAFTD